MINKLVSNSSFRSLFYPCRAFLMHRRFFLILHLTRCCLRLTQESSLGARFLHSFNNGHFNTPYYSLLLQPLCCRFSDRCELSFFSCSLLEVTRLRLFPDFISCQRWSLRMTVSSTLHFISALAVVSPTSRLRDTSPILDEADHLCNNTVYTNCLLATLNARKIIRNAGSDSSDALSMMEFARVTSTGELERVRWKIPFLRIIEKPNKLLITQRPTNISMMTGTTKGVAGDAKRDTHDLETVDVGAFRPMVL